VRGDETQREATGNDGLRARSGPRHAAPRKSLLTKLQIPAGKAMALAAVPTAVFVGMGLTPRLALADDSKGVSSTPGPCITRSDEPGDSASPSPSATPNPSASGAAKDGSGTAGASKDGADPKPSTTPSAPRSRTKPPLSDPAVPRTPSAPPASQGGSGGGGLLGGVGSVVGGLSGLLGLGSPSSNSSSGSGSSGSGAPAGSPSQSPSSSSASSSSAGQGTDSGAKGGAADGASGTKSGGAADAVGKPADKLGKAVDKTVDRTTDSATKKVKDTESALASQQSLEDAIRAAAKKAGVTVQDLSALAGSLTPQKDPDAPADTASDQPFPCATPDPQALADAKEEQGVPLVPDDPWTLKSSLLTLSGLDYKGIVDVRTSSGKLKPALKFTASSIDIKDLKQSVVYPDGRTGHTDAGPGTTSTIRNGTVTLYTEKLSGNLLGLLPITFSPQTPPPVNLPFAFFTNAEVTQAGQFGGTLDIPQLHGYVT
jgi:hypothetical protein